MIVTVEKTQTHTTHSDADRFTGKQKIPPRKKKGNGRIRCSSATGTNARHSRWEETESDLHWRERMKTIERRNLSTRRSSLSEDSLTAQRQRRRDCFNYCYFWTCFWLTAGGFHSHFGWRNERRNQSLLRTALRTAGAADLLDWWWFLAVFHDPAAVIFCHIKYFLLWNINKKRFFHVAT